MNPAVLLVDDEPSICSALRRTLKQHQYQVFEANNGEQALNILHENTIDVVVSDQRMPGMSGTQLLGEVKQRHPNTGRIILSGHSDTSDLAEAINEASVHRFITKPWNDQHLLEVLKSTIPQTCLPKISAQKFEPSAKKRSSCHTNLLILEDSLTKKKIDLEQSIKNDILDLSQKTYLHHQQVYDAIHYQHILWPKFLHFQHKGILNIASQSGYLHDLFNWYLFTISEKFKTPQAQGKYFVIDLFCDAYTHNKSTQKMLSAIANENDNVLFRISFDTLGAENFADLLSLSYKTNSDLLLFLGKRVFDLDSLIQTPIRYIEMDGNPTTINNHLLTEKRMKMLGDAQSLGVKTILNNTEHPSLRNYGKTMGFDFF